MQQLTISLGQMDILLGEPEHNLATVRQMTAEAARRGSDLVVFPELWSTGYDLDHAADYATTTDAGIFKEVGALAQEYRIAIVGSCLSVLGSEKFGNTAVYTAPSGQNLTAYSKTHLFRLMNEEQYLTAGDKLSLAATAWGKMGLAICYDLRFPELFRAYALAGATAVLLPAEWPYPRLAHWRTLLRARAIENQMFVIACNRVGQTGDTRFFGRSAIIDPWGEIVVEGGDQELLLTATIDLEMVTAVRERIPVFADRRPDIY
ncbi:MAG: carbon-nitrogen family hydrolase [Anaerolineales bacterium]|nr:carbon-nitrogen family hydrolase [Anaerolineales bacterium]